jgi:ankyrin repeat protein
VRALNEVSFEGATALALAAEVNNLEAIKALVEGGADPNIATAQGTTPLILADERRPRAVERTQHGGPHAQVPRGTLED